MTAKAVARETPILAPRRRPRPWLTTPTLSPIPLAIGSSTCSSKLSSVSAALMKSAGTAVATHSAGVGPLNVDSARARRRRTASADPRGCAENSHSASAAAAAAMSAARARAVGSNASCWRRLP